MISEEKNVTKRRKEKELNRGELRGSKEGEQRNLQWRYKKAPYMKY